MGGLAEWQTRYAAGERGPSRPSSVVILASSMLAPARALDLAAGAGRNALFLAKNGWDVVAVDGAPAALDLIRCRALELDVELDIRLLDLERESIPFEDGSFDLVCDVLYLQRSLFPHLRRLVRPGGLMAMEVLVGDSRPAGDPAWRLAPGELATLFDGWEVVHFQHHEEPGRRPSEELILRRPTSG